MYREDGLPAGTVVEGDEIRVEIQRLLRADRFVLTYVARDVASGKSLAVTEYLPRDWGRRRRDGRVEPQTESDAEQYRWGLTRFFEESRLAEQLAKRGADGYLARVEGVIEARGTAYVALEYESVRTLEESRKAGLSEARVGEVLSDVEAGLERLHAAGLYHYDVTPWNVVEREDGTTALLFACGRTRQEMARRCRTAVGVFSPGYAAAEQEEVQGKDGPWTDIHALGGLAYWALSGRAPDGVSGQSAERRRLAVGQGSEAGVSEGLASAVASALARDVRERPQSLAEWHERRTAPADEGADDEPVAAPWARWAMAAAVVVLLGLVSTWAVVERQLREQAEAELAQAVVAGEDRESELNEDVERLSEGLAEADVALTMALDRIERLQARQPGFQVLDFPECDYCPWVVALSGGTFMMGSHSEHSSDNERPLHSRRIGSFAIGQREVTRTQYGLFEQDAGVTPGSRQCRVAWDASRAYPMTCVSWSEAKAYVDWLAEKTGRPYRLPTEAEWEYAARAGTTTDWYWGESEVPAGELANFEGARNPSTRIAEVGLFAANEFQLLDMAGNVQEWVADCWHDTYEGAPSDGTAWENTSCTRRVVRGGAYDDSIVSLRSSARHPLPVVGRGLRTGFRVAMSLE